MNHLNLFENFLYEEQWPDELEKIYQRQSNAIKKFGFLTKDELIKFCDLAFDNYKKRDKTLIDGYFDKSIGFSNEQEEKKVAQKLANYIKFHIGALKENEEPGTEHYPPAEDKAEYPWLSITFGSDQTNVVNNVLEALKKEGHIRKSEHKPSETGDGLTYFIQFDSVYGVYLFGWHQAQFKIF